MEIRVAQLNPIIGDLKGNEQKIIESLIAAQQDNIDLLILPEMVSCGYPPMDLLEYPSFLQELYKMNNRLAGKVGDTALILGTVTPNHTGKGRKCYNSALALHQGEVKAEIHKALLPTYDVFDEHRYFEPGSSFQCIELFGKKLGITICEDIWYNYSEPQYVTYDVNPGRALADMGAEIILNLSASPYTRNKPEGRERMLRKQVDNLKLPILYANQVGGNTELISDGDSLAMDQSGNVKTRCTLFEEDAIDINWEGKESSLQVKNGMKKTTPSLPEQQFKGLVTGLRDYLQKTEVADKVVLGLSGGIDSSLVACIAREALGADNVIGITMPSEFSSTGSVTDSEKLANALGIGFHEIAIKGTYNSFTETLAPLFENTSFGVAEENLQPRIRGTLLMAYSNKFGHMLLNTGNKSELATGYCTMYGDMAGGLSVIGDLYKQEVYAIAHWLNNEYYKEEVIPQSVLNKPPSAELRPDQKDTDSLPDYEVLDAILQAYIEEQKTIDEIIAQNFEKETVNRILGLVDQMEYKRAQAAPVLKLSSKSFGSGRRWPLVQRWAQNRS